VLVGTDFSAASQRALLRAIQIAGDKNAVIHVVHAAARVPPALARKYSLADDAKLREALDAVVGQVRGARVRAHGHLLQGDPVKALTVKARALAADLVIVGTHGRAVRDAVVGSTAERLSAYDQHRVLLVRRASARPYTDVVLAAGEQSDLRGQATGAAFLSDAAPSVLHAYEGAFESSLRLHGASGAALSSYRGAARREAEAALGKLLDRAGLDRAQLVLRHGNPKQVLQRIAPGALLVLRRSRSRLRQLLLGSVTRTVIAQGASDVLLV
jgi:nucleotide-binding universal stress UspA family protein